MTADVPRSQKSLLAKSHLIRTPIAMQLKWLLGAVHRRKHPELWELYLEEKRLLLPLARLLKSDSCAIDVGAHVESFLSSTESAIFPDSLGAAF